MTTSETPQLDIAKEPTNTQRIAWAWAALRAFCKAEGVVPDPTPEDDLTDLVTDLMHLCAVEHISFNRILDRAEMHFETERHE